MKITTDILLEAYKQGYFPMAESRNAGTLRWFDPEYRGILTFDGFHVPRSLRKTLRGQVYKVTFNTAFGRVIRACADARKDTWINDEIIALYTSLHKKGFAMSAESWTEEGELAGGLYGVCIGRAFFGESMFSVSTDASKVALVHLMARLWSRGCQLVDAQFVNDHLLQFGISEIPRADYKKRLEKAVSGYSSASSNEEGSSSSFGAGAAGFCSGSGVGVTSSGGSSLASGMGSSATSSTAGSSTVTGVTGVTAVAGSVEGLGGDAAVAGASVVAASTAAADSSTGVVGAFSEENFSDFATVEAFLQSITHTS